MTIFIYSAYMCTHTCENTPMYYIDIEDIYWLFSKEEMDENQPASGLLHFYFNRQICMSLSHTYTYMHIIYIHIRMYLCKVIKVIRGRHAYT